MSGGAGRFARGRRPLLPAPCRRRRAVEVVERADVRLGVVGEGTVDPKARHPVILVVRVQAVPQVQVIIPANTLDLLFSVELSK